MRAVANLTLSFGLVSIPVKLYSATEGSAAIRLHLMAPSGHRIRQQYVADAGPPEAEPAPGPAPRVAAEPMNLPAPERRGRFADAARDAAPAVAPPARLTPAPPWPESTHRAPAARFELAPRVVERHEMVRGYEFERGQFVLFTPDELKALQAESRDSIDIVAFIPAGSVDPVYYDKAYLLAPGARGEKTYSLLLAALQRSGRSALAKWVWKGKQFVVEVRAAEGGLVLQQLFYADEVRSPAQLRIGLVDVSAAELDLAVRLIEQGAQDAYDPAQFVDEEKQRLLDAVEKKIAGREVVASEREPKPPPGAQVIDLMEVLRASLRQGGLAAAAAAATAAANGEAAPKTRRPSRKAAENREPAAAPRGVVRRS